MKIARYSVKDDAETRVEAIQSRIECDQSIYRIVRCDCFIKDVITIIQLSPIDAIIGTDHVPYLIRAEIIERFIILRIDIQYI